MKNVKVERLPDRMIRATMSVEQWQTICEQLDKYAKIRENNSRAGKTYSSRLSPEERSARAKKAVEARIAKYGQARRKSD